MIEVTEVSIAELRAALESGQTTAVELVQAYLARIDAYDGPDTATALNAVVVRNPEVLEEARASDERRAKGQTLGPLDGIPYTAKDSYLVKGLTAASGSPAFANLIAYRDAFTIERLRAGGAICLGKTNMPPMANGGMQRGVYGRAESPYNAAYLTAPFASGSSNGAGTATAASFAAFGLAEETWSSGRGPASNNGLCAYTPSRGVISVRGNWPLTPTMDVVVPFARTMNDLLEVLDIVVADDPDTRGDLWRLQPWVPIPSVEAVRPASYLELAAGAGSLAGKRLGIPKMYINADPEAGTSEAPGIGGPTGQRIHTRPSVIELWEQARKALEAAGAEVIEVDFPLVSNCEGDRPGAPTVFNRGLVSKAFLHHELWDLTAWAFDDFLQANGDPKLNRLVDVDGPQIFPHDPGTLPNREGDLAAGMDEYVKMAERGITPWDQISTVPDGLRGLEKTRKIDLEDWMDRLGLDAVLFPTVADVGPADADVNPASADIAWSNGVWVANGNLAIRHLGVPTVTVPMGVMADIGMPVGLTFAGRAYDDSSLLRLASAFESTGSKRMIPPRTPLLQQMDNCMNTGMLDFASQGYAVITGLLDDNGLASARTLVDRVVSQHRAGAATHLACGVSIADVTRQHPGRNPDIDPQAWPHEPFIISDLIALDGGFAALFHTESLWRCAARLLECEPADVVFHFCNLTRKPRGIGPAVGWHRDAGNQYFASEDNRTLRLLLPLQGMRADNGATAVVPGSHVDPGAAVDNALIPDVPAGAGLALHAAVLHGGSPNRSGQDRDVIVIQFGVRGSTLSHQADEALALAGREAFA